MVESGFFVQVFKWLADAVVGKIEDDLVENISDSVRDKKEKAQIKQKLNKTFERYFKEQYEYLPLSKEFDINTLNEWLLENLYSIVLNYFIADSSEKRSYYKSSLMESSYARARADTKEKKQAVYAYVDSFLKAFEQYYFDLKDSHKEQYLLNKQTDDIKAIIQLGNKELKAFIQSENQHNSFAKFIDKLELKPIKTTFHFLNPKIGFVRREAEFKLLDDFLEHEDPFLSLVITGFGGIGKSKLLHHYIFELRYNLDWKAVMLNRSQIDKLCDPENIPWEYPKNLLLVIDYAAEKSKKIGEWIQSIHSFKGNRFKKRIILLERQGLTKVNDQIIQPLWYTEMNKASSNILEEIQYESVDGFYDLPRFNKDQMYQVMDMLPDAKTRLDEAEKEAIYEKIIGFSGDYQDERFNTPLIALLLADAHIKGKDIPDAKQLMLYVIERDKKSWERYFPVSTNRTSMADALERLTVYATATGGCDLARLQSPLAEDWELLKDNLTTHNLTALLTSLNGIDYECHQLDPLKPDIIGEFFVLNYIDMWQHKKICKRIVKACWDKPHEFLSFLIRCVNSYLGDFPKLVFGKQAILLQGADSFPKALLFLGMTFNSEINLCKQAVEHLKELYQENESAYLAELFAKGLFNLSVEQETAAARQETIAELKVLSEKWSENAEIALIYAKGLFNLTVKQETAAARQETVAELKVLSEKWSENAEIALAYAKGLFNLTVKQETAAALEETVAKLKELNGKWSENAEIALRYARGLVNLSNKQETAAARQETVAELKVLIESLKTLVNT